MIVYIVGVPSATQSQQNLLILIVKDIVLFFLMSSFSREYITELIKFQELLLCTVPLTQSIVFEITRYFL